MAARAHLRPVPSDRRRQALDLFGQLLEIPAVERLVQRGREHETARYTLELRDGRAVRVGTAKVLFSQTQMAQVLGVTIGCVPPPVESKDWRKMITALLNHAVEVEEVEGESFAETVRDWLGAYARGAGTDANGCAAKGRPFTRDGWLHVHAPSLAVYIRRHYATAVKDRELREALTDIGFERRTVNYTPGSGERTTISLYCAPTAILTDAPEQE